MTGIINQCFFKCLININFSNDMQIDNTLKDSYFWKAVIGAIAQLGERLSGSQKVSGSSPLSSTNTGVEDLINAFLFCY